MIKGTTKTGFNFELDDDVIDDCRKKERSLVQDSVIRKEAGKLLRDREEYWHSLRRSLSGAS